MLGVFKLRQLRAASAFVFCARVGDLGPFMKRVEMTIGQVTFLKADPRAGRLRMIAAPSTTVL